MTLWAKRTDGNHAEIRQAMRDAGCNVFDLSGAGKGAPDTIVFNPTIHRLWLVEIKMPDGKLTKPQVDFHRDFPVHIVRSVDDAMELINSGITGATASGASQSSNRPPCSLNFRKP